MCHCPSFSKDTYGKNGKWTGPILKHLSLATLIRAGDNKPLILTQLVIAWLVTFISGLSLQVFFQLSHVNSQSPLTHYAKASRRRRWQDTKCSGMFCRRPAFFFLLSGETRDVFLFSLSFFDHSGVIWCMGMTVVDGGGCMCACLCMQCVTKSTVAKTKLLFVTVTVLIWIGKSNDSNTTIKYNVQDPTKQLWPWPLHLRTTSRWNICCLFNKYPGWWSGGVDCQG